MSDFTVRFWGVRGSIPCPGPATQRYGGNTSCVEVRCGERLIILDAGSGLRELGNALVKQSDQIDADILLTHCHYDHVAGLPFFAPFYKPQNQFRLRAGSLLPHSGVKTMVQTLMSEPLFSIDVDKFRADINYCDFIAGESMTLGDVTIRTAPLNHPGKATGYRIDYAGRSLAYLTDHEAHGGDSDAALVELARGADLVIYDTTYTDDEIGSRRGWGHSTWRDGFQLVDAAGAKTFCLFHHAPEHDDDTMDAILREAEAERPGTIAAKEQAVIRL